MLTVVILYVVLYCRYQCAIIVETLKIVCVWNDSSPT